MRTPTISRIAAIAGCLAGISATTSYGATPVDPLATPEARSLLDYVHSVAGKQILSAQQETNNCGGASNSEIDYLKSNTGKNPAIRAMDMNDAWTCGATQRAIDWWKAGGIVMFGWHWGAPGKANSYEGSQMAVSINAVLTPGTTEYASFIRRLDSTAVQIKKLQDANVPIIWRPFHEAAGTWFWWSKEGGGQYVRLWKFMFDYYTKTKGLHNMVWLHPYCGSPDASFWPGKAYADLGGADTYVTDHGPLTSLYNSVKKIVGNGVPIGLHENGAIPDPALLQSSGTSWFMFCTWNGKFLTSDQYNTKAFLKTVYSSPYVITRDELPDLRNFSTGVEERSSLELPVKVSRNQDGLAISCHGDGCESLSLFDLNGREVFLDDGETSRIPAGRLRSGMYVLRASGVPATRIFVDR